MSKGLAGILEKCRDNWKAWRTAFFVLLAVLFALNFFIHPHHPHFGLDKYPGFFPVFGFVVGVGMVVLVKKIIQPFIGHKEDYYGD